MKLDLYSYQVLFLFALAAILVGVGIYAYGGGVKRLKFFVGTVVVLTVFVWPPAQLSLSTHNLHRSKEVSFCASCHEMAKHVEDVTHRASRSLSGKHMKRFWINNNQCYTCHTDYSLFGPVEAKVKGLVHMYKSLFADIREEEIELYDQPYPDSNCLQCHDPERFDKVEEHQDAEPDERCIDCHDNVHKVKRKNGEEEGEGDL